MYTFGIWVESEMAQSESKEKNPKRRASKRRMALERCLRGTVDDEGGDEKATVTPIRRGQFRDPAGSFGKQ